MTNPNSSDIKALRIVYIALMLGVVVFLLIAFAFTLRIGSLGINDPVFEQVLLVVSTIMALVSIPSGIIIFKKRTENIQNLNLPEKLSIFRSAMVLRAATMEGAGFFFIICVINTGSKVSMIEAIVVLAIMLLYFPTNTRLASEMKHDLEEIESISENKEF
jgi:ascorbate-specific PTS system EIIC-type component UlaA